MVGLSIGLIGATVYVAYQQQVCGATPKGNDCQQCCNACPSVAGTPPQIGKNQSISDANEPKPSTQWWYELFAWPDGFTGCALFLTLCAIMWQSGATAKSVETSVKALALQGKTAKQQLRAYVTISKAYVIFHDEERNVEFYVGFRNCGQTPAYKFEGISRSGLSVHPIPDQPELIRNHHKSSGIIGSDSLYHIKVWSNPALDISRDDLIGYISKPRTVIYIEGKFTYKDIFGDVHTLHIQQIAGGPSRVRGTNMKDKAGQQSFVLSYDSERNDAD